MEYSEEGKLKRKEIFEKFTLVQLTKRIRQIAPAYATIPALVYSYVQDKEELPFNSLIGNNGILVTREDVGIMLEVLHKKLIALYNPEEKPVTDNNARSLKELRELREQKIMKVLPQLTKKDFEFLLSELSKPAVNDVVCKGVLFFKSDREAIEVYFASQVVDVEIPKEEERPFRHVSDSDLRDSIAMLTADYTSVDNLNGRHIGATRENISQLKRELELRQPE